jgi:predicted nucleic acid-binding protein
VKLFLDANILFTAAYSKQGIISRTLFRLAEAGRCSLITSAYTADEARRNLAVKAQTALPEFRKLLEAAAIVREPAPAVVARMKQLPLAEKDAPIMAAAVEFGSDILVTGDRRDFGHLFGLEVEGVLVLNPADTLDRVMSEVKR